MWPRSSLSGLVGTIRTAARATSTRAEAAALPRTARPVRAAWAEAIRRARRAAGRGRAVKVVLGAQVQVVMAVVGAMAVGVTAVVATAVVTTAVVTTAVVTTAVAVATAAVAAAAVAAAA